MSPDAPTISLGGRKDIAPLSRTLGCCLGSPFGMVCDAVVSSFLCISSPPQVSFWTRLLERTTMNFVEVLLSFQAPLSLVWPVVLGIPFQTGSLLADSLELTNAFWFTFSTCGQFPFKTRPGKKWPSLTLPQPHIFLLCTITEVKKNPLISHIFVSSSDCQPSKEAPSP